MNNDKWQAQVRRFLAEGYGTEDIAVLMACNVEDVRAEVKILRDEGFWKGEHLIRVTSLTHEGGATTAILRKHRESGQRHGTCAVPDCGAALSKSNKSGVCFLHNHKKPHCECRSCKPE